MCHLGFCGKNQKIRKFGQQQKLFYQGRIQGQHSSQQEPGIVPLENLEIRTQNKTFEVLSNHLNLNWGNYGINRDVKKAFKFTTLIEINEAV